MIFAILGIVNLSVKYLYQASLGTPRGFGYSKTKMNSQSVVATYGLEESISIMRKTFGSNYGH